MLKDETNWVASQIYPNVEPMDFHSKENQNLQSLGQMIEHLVCVFNKGLKQGQKSNGTVKLNQQTLAVDDDKHV